MIRQFIRTTIADLANAVARSELAKENAQLRSTLADKHAALVQANDYSSEVADERDFLRSKLEAAENERDHIRENFASAVKAAERRSPVDRSTAIEEVKKIFSTWWATVGWNMDRMSGRIVDAILGAQKEAPVEKPAAFVPAETDAEPSAELVERMAELSRNTWDGASYGWSSCTPSLKDRERNCQRAVYALIARDHAAAVKRVGELQAEVARLSAPFPADGMSAVEVGRQIYVHGDLEATGSGAIKIFRRPAK